MAETSWTQKAGMTSDADTDNIENYSEQAAASEAAAQASEEAAAASASAASTSASSAASSASQSASSASSASASASQAATSASGAATSATNAASSASSAATSATAAASSATAADASATAAAASEDQVSTDALAASNSATDAATSETNAAASEAAAAASEAAALSSETAAAGSATDAASSATSAATSETNAAASETAAAASETAAAGSASAAATSATAAAGSATAAAASETAAASSASSASASADAALTALDNFDDRYLGQKASDPTLDNDGNALIAGALYFNTTDSAMKVYEGSTWVAAYASLSGALLAANNLSDLSNAVSARSNLGLGTAATTAATDYATAAQGALADSALQSSDIGVSIQGYSAILSGTTASYTTAEETKLAGIEAGADVTDTANVTAAGALMDSEVTNLAAVKAFDPTDYATAAQGALADSAVQPADLGTAAATDSTDYATAAQGALADSAVQPNDTPTFAGLSTTANITFGDNDKAIFGAGSDLQILHDGTHSYISEVGTGDLRISGATNVDIRDNAGYKTFRGVSRGEAILYHDNSQKLATTSTGVDVTGTITSDGLTVESTGEAAALFKGYTSVTDVDSVNNGEILIGNNPSFQGRISYEGQSAGVLYIENSYSNNAADIVFRAKSSGTAQNKLLIEGTGDISFYEDTGTTPKFFWDSSAERLGIGTSSPTYALDVRGVSVFGDGTDGVKLTYSAGNSTGIIDTGFTSTGLEFRTGNSFAAIIDSSGRVGIGTNSPLYELHVEDATGNAVVNIESSTSGYSAVNLGDTNNDDVGQIKYDNSTNSMQFTTNASEAMRIDSSGNLNLVSSSGSLIDLNFTDASLNDYARIEGGKSGSGVGDLRFYTYSGGLSEAMRIDSSGNLLVGKTTTGLANQGAEFSSTGQVKGTAPNQVVGYFNRTSSDGSILEFRKDNSTVGSIGVGSSSSSGIYIGRSNYSALFFDNNKIKPWNASTNVIRDNAIDLGSAGGRFKDAHFSGTVNAANFNTTSDATLKTNVETLTGSLDAVKAMRGVSYDWIDSGNSEVGVIAQEVEAVVPDVVSTNDQGIKSVKYGNLVGVLIEAIKEQQQRIEALEAKLGD
jgi:hypothetical protein